jgi:hypothetical protein
VATDATGAPNCRCCSTSFSQATPLVVTRIDRLARSLKDLQDIVHELKGRGVALRATEQPVATAAGKAFLDMLGVFAEFETNLRRERQLEGIAQAKARGVYRGRKPSIDMAEIRRLRDQDGLGATAIARRLGQAENAVADRPAPGACVRGGIRGRRQAYRRDCGRGGAIAADR